ncbi:sensor histidine kinase [Chondrinema litorale]|uniref:sensor histidine kinase n=1 Tax=Chondrinema litorale TaxID=2994555 RepID=UPI002543481C|nr:HAMP domain-containing sensor histidine kinase [Chondrinema litorale]UZR92789.1 HAMP domain-containing sensor histidine kinase [Chondrinema litorale]
MFFCYLILDSKWQVTPVLTLLTVLFSIVELIRFHEMQLQYLEKYLVAIKHNDISGNYMPKLTGKYHNRIRETTQSIHEELRKLRSENQSEKHFSDYIVNKLPGALMCYNDAREIIVLNEAFKAMFGVSYLSVVDQLDKFIPGFTNAINELQTKGKTLFSFTKEGKPWQVLMYYSVFVKDGKKIYVITLQDIQSEMIAAEVASWQKLIRVMAHEIINTVTPIVSLASVMHDKSLSKLKQVVKDEKQFVFGNLEKGLFTITQRGKGLIHFVDNYRKFSKTVSLDYRGFSIYNLFERTITLFRHNTENEDIRFVVKEIHKDLSIYADVELIEQVLINLTVNAIAACRTKSNPEIIFVATKNQVGAVVIRVVDNGVGIPLEIQDQIFTPFFTTKENGSGIGLSFSRQIMNFHGGSIDVYSEPEKGSSVTLEFPVKK